MYDGSRVTDAVEYWKRREELKKAVGILRQRSPERFRWRRAVAAVTETTGLLRGLDRMRIEEPVREIVLDLDDEGLRREVVIDARRVGVDLDRGEVLPRRTLRDIVGLARVSGADLGRVERHVRLPGELESTVDTAALIVVGRALADHHRKKSQRLLLSIPDPDSPEPRRLHHKIIEQRAQQDRDEAQRWLAFARAVLDSTPVSR